MQFMLIIMEYNSNAMKMFQIINSSANKKEYVINEYTRWYTWSLEIRSFLIPLASNILCRI